MCLKFFCSIIGSSACYPFSNDLILLLGDTSSASTEPLGGADVMWNFTDWTRPSLLDTEESVVNKAVFKNSLMILQVEERWQTKG